MGVFGTGIERLCAVAAAATAKELVRQVQFGAGEARTIELRLDWLKTDLERTAFLRWFKKHRPPRVTFIATCRRRAGGGSFSGDIPAELYWLMAARAAGCAWCDLEIETLCELPGESIREYAVPSRVLLSIHDFERTPALPKLLKTPIHGEVDAVKIAAMAHTIEDSLRLLRLARSSKKIVAVPMGEAGLPARILALRAGSSLSYAPIGEATAPGQVSLHGMKHLYRTHKLTNRTQVFGVIGDPIGHSLSPLLHNTGFAARSVDAVYLPFLVKKLPDFMQAIPELGIRGFSVTIPHKQSILEHLDECEPLAAEIGAVNTVIVRRNGSLYGCNTDYVGVLHALQNKLKLTGSRVLVFGAGGSARAAAMALAREGAQVFICARRDSAAQHLARAVSGEVVPRRALRSQRFDAILNATPLGMHPRVRVSPLEPRELNCRIVMDLIYRPQKTQLLLSAAQKGIATVSGVEMFLAQGIVQWELWAKQRAPEAAMRRAVLSALRAEEKSRGRR